MCPLHKQKPLQDSSVLDLDHFFSLYNLLRIGQFYPSVHKLSNLISEGIIVSKDNLTISKESLNTSISKAFR